MQSTWLIRDWSIDTELNLFSDITTRAHVFIQNTEKAFLNGENVHEFFVNHLKHGND